MGLELTFRAVTTAEWPDMQQLFSKHGVQNGCWCMYWRVRRSDFHRHFGEPHRQAMEKLIINQHPVGILAYHDDQPIGWCSVAPRHEFAVLDRSPTLKPVDDKPVWSIVCFFVSKPYRQQGVCGQLIEAALVYARSNGARIVEAYPLIPENTVEPRYERYSGVITTFLKAGFVEIARRSARKPIMRYYFNP